jgi:predicted ester cyclase
MFKSFLLFPLVLFSGLISICSASPTLTPEELKAFYKEAYAHTVENMQSTKADYSQYFAKDFVMHMDGQTLNFDDYVQFMLDIRKGVDNVKIEFKDMIAENDGVATVHTTRITKNNGERITLNVISFFKVRNRQFTSGHELTRLE